MDVMDVYMWSAIGALGRVTSSEAGAALRGEIGDNVNAYFLSPFSALMVD